MKEAVLRVYGQCGTAASPLSSRSEAYRITEDASREIKEHEPIIQQILEMLNDRDGIINEQMEETDLVRWAVLEKRRLNLTRALTLAHLMVFARCRIESAEGMSKL